MSVTKRRMEPGSFDVRLRPSTPVSITDQLTFATQAFAHLIVTPAWIPPHFFSTAANLVATSIYTGVIRVRESRLGYSGAHASILLGDEDGKGQLPEVVTTATQSFSAWMTALKPPNVLTNGSYNASATTLAWTWAIGQSRRDAIDYICQTMGYDWQVTDDLYLNGDTAANLYGAADVLLTPSMDGTGDVDYRAVRATIGSTLTAEDYTTKTIVKDDAGAFSTSGPGTVPFDDHLGNDYVWKRYIDGGSTVTSGTGSTVAAQQLGRFDQIDQRIRARTDVKAVMANVEVGSTVMAWDPDADVYDLNNETYWRGTLVYPLEVPVQAITMPLEEGMGVYVRLNGASPSVVDLTPYMEWEGAGATIELGTPRPRLAPALFMRGINGLAEGGYLS